MEISVNEWRPEHYSNLLLPLFSSKIPKKSTISSYGCLLLSLFFVALLLSEAIAETGLPSSLNVGDLEKGEMVPVGEKKWVVFNESVHKMTGEGFHICSPCNCCNQANRSLCFPCPCCFALECSLREKQFGLCSFNPKKCNCFDCVL